MTTTTTTTRTGPSQEAGVLELNGHKVTEATLAAVVTARASLGDKTFAAIDGESISYAETDARSNRIANGLIELGVVPGDVVITYMHNSVDHVLAWFGIAKTGAVWSPLNIALMPVDLEYTIGNVEPKALIVDSELLDNVLAVTGIDRSRIIVRGADGDVDGCRRFEDLEVDDATSPSVEVDPTDPAAVIFTGGSTGMPKGVVVSNLWFIVAALRYGEMFDPTDGDAHLGVGQMCHAIGSSIDVFCPLYHGLTTTLARWFSATRFWDLAREADATILGCIVGPLIAMLCNQEPSAEDRNHRVRVASSGTAQVPRETVEGFEKRFGIELLEIYGQTETGPLGAIGQRHDDRPYYSQGKPNGWCDVMIGDERDLPCGANVTGQILMRPTIPYTFLLEYHKVPEKYVEATRNFWFHTGDIGHLDDRGFLFFTGRLAHAIRVRGENVSAFEVEQVVLSHDSILECAAVGVPSEIGDEDIKIYVELVAGSEFDPVEIIDHLRERIAYFKIPRYIEVVDSWPRSTAKNEIERHQLRERGVGEAWDRVAAGIDVRRRRT